MSRSPDAADRRLLNVVRALSGWLEIYLIRWRSSHVRAAQGKAEIRARRERELL